jgi:type I restriction enzyme S subunit
MVESKTKVQLYDTYKESGVEWLGEIPKHWELGRLASILNPVSSKNHPNETLLSITREKGVIVRNIEDEDSNHNFIPDDLTGYKLLKEGQFGMNKMKAWQGSYGVSSHKGIVSPAYYTFEFTKDIEPRFFHLAIRSKLYVSFFGKASDGVRIGQWDLSKNRMKRIPLAIPPLKEQTKIAEFLDDKATKIEDAIAIKKQQINLLKEHKQILIHKVVTQGLNPNVKLKDSGVEWIGEIPEHWGVKKLKYILNEKLKYGANESGIDYDVKLPRYIRITDFGNDGKLNEKNKLSLSWKNGGDYLLNDGDILFARSGATVGKTYQFKKSMSIENEYCFAGYLIKAEANEEIILSDFLYLFTNSELFNKWKDSIFIKATIENIGADKYSQLNVIVPPLNEQKEILIKYSNDNSKIETAIRLKQQEIEKLKEYKSSLINSVVTGKVKVC